MDFKIKRSMIFSSERFDCWSKDLKRYPSQAEVLTEIIYWWGMVSLVFYRWVLLS